MHDSLPPFRFGTNTSVHVCIVCYKSSSVQTSAAKVQLLCQSFRVDSAESEAPGRNRSRRVKRRMGVKSTRTTVGIHGPRSRGWRRRGFLLHFYSTTAESRAMTATPLNMSRICRRDCLGGRKKNKQSDAFSGRHQGGNFTQYTWFCSAFKSISVKSKNGSLKRASVVVTTLCNESEANEREEKKLQSTLAATISRR